jgi:hypothetical protein
MSAGFSASKATAIFMDYETAMIVHVETGDHRETGRNSSKLETHLVRRGLNVLLTTHLCLVWEVITDASRGLIKLFSRLYKRR